MTTYSVRVLHLPHHQTYQHSTMNQSRACNIHTGMRVSCFSLRVDYTSVSCCGIQKGAEGFLRAKFRAAVPGRMTDTMTLLTSSENSAAEWAAQGSAVADTR